MADPLEDRLDLLLAEADRCRPVLKDGLAAESALAAPRPKSASVKELRRVEADWDDLAHQGWAVIAPEGPKGDQMLEAISSLCALRDREQGSKALVFRAAPGMDARRAADWKEHHLHPEDGEEEDSPLYTLILGDLDDVSLELQQVLATDTLVGRLHFEGDEDEPDLDAFAAYADKVVRAEEIDVAEDKPDLLFFAAEDGTHATLAGKTRLIQPGVESARDRVRNGKLKAASVESLTATTVSAMLAAAGRPRPAVLVSVSHGLGPPREGFLSEDEKRRRQGAMVIGRSEILDAEAMSKQAFLPCGMWFHVACFGAGTPSMSAYRAWLSQLADAGAYGSGPASVLRALPGPGERPFVAALPQAALASPRGPLAVIGHMDLAWTYAFSGARKLTTSRASRLLQPVERLVQGSRAGVALGRLMQEYGEVNDDLMREYQLDRDARAANRPSPIDAVEMAHMWMLRNDLRGYVLLGDPAARLPLSRAQHEAQTARPARPFPVKSADSDPPVDSLTERALRSVAAPPAPMRSSPPARSTLPGPRSAYPPPRSAYPPGRSNVPPPPPPPPPLPRGGPFSRTLPSRTSPFAKRSVPPSEPPHEPPAEDPAREPTLSPEGAVLAMLTGDLPPRTIARKAGVSLDVLWEWLDVYRDGGRSRLRIP